VKWLGFTGSGLLWLALGLAGSGLAFRFSWTHVAERIGRSFDGLVVSRREKRERAEDEQVGLRAAREREVVMQEERAEARQHPVVPVQIEPVMAEVQKSTRVVKERQKPLFTELPDSKLPQVDLLDGATARQETVSAETLEMTSRLIEKNSRTLVSMCGWCWPRPGR